MKTVLSVFIVLFLCQLGLSQQKITGLIVDGENKGPVSFASVAFEKGEGAITDTAGKFSLTIRRQSRLNDSIIISAIGYQTTKITAQDLLKNGQVLLSRVSLELQQVRVYASIKGDERRFGYYRAWSEKNTGGEIGYVFDLPTTSIFLGAVQVKLNHNYDTCWLKLHLRDVAMSGFGLPENEVLKEEVVLPVTIKYGMAEFDMKWKVVKLPTKRIYVGFELLKCGCSTSAAPSFFFMGNEFGQNFYRESANAIWKKGGDNTIYIRMLAKEKYF